MGLGEAHFAVTLGATLRIHFSFCFLSLALCFPLGFLDLLNIFSPLNGFLFQGEVILYFSDNLQTIRQGEANRKTNFSWCFESVSYLKWDIIKVTESPMKICTQLLRSQLEPECCSRHARSRKVLPPTGLPGSVPAELLTARGRGTLPPPTLPAPGQTVTVVTTVPQPPC